MCEECDKLRLKIDQYTKAKRSFVDTQTSAALDQMIAEAEAKILSLHPCIEARRPHRKGPGNRPGPKFCRK